MHCATQGIRTKMHCAALSQGNTTRPNTGKHQRKLDCLVWKEHVMNGMLIVMLCCVLLFCDASGTSAGAILLPSGVLVAMRDNVNCSHHRKDLLQRVRSIV